MKESIEIGARRESEPARFDWRGRLKRPDEMPPRLAEKLDELEEYANARGEDTQEFWEAMGKGQYRKPLLSLIQYFRELLTKEERSELNEAIEKHE